MIKLKILKTALLCIPGILCNVCAPSQNTPSFQIVAPGQIDNCFNPNKPMNFIPSGGHGGRPNAECITNHGSGYPQNNQQQVPYCADNSSQYPGGGSGFPGGNQHYPGYPNHSVPIIPGGLPNGGIPLQPAISVVPVIPVAPSQPVQPVQPVAPPKDAGTTITQIVPPSPATTIIQPTTPSIVPVQPTTSSAAPVPPQQQTQCKIQVTQDCVPVGPEEEIPEPQTPQPQPQPAGPPAQTVVHVVPPTSPGNQPGNQPGSQPGTPANCIPSSVNPPVNPSNNQPSVCVPIAPSAPSYPAPTPAPAPSGPSNGPSYPQAPVNLVYVPTNTQSPGGPNGPSGPTGSNGSQNCTNPSNLINSLCDNSVQSHPVSSGNKITSCDTQNNSQCLQNIVNSPPQVTPQDAMECVTSQRPQIDIGGVLAPASDSYVQAYNNPC